MGDKRNPDLSLLLPISLLNRTRDSGCFQLRLPGFFYFEDAGDSEAGDPLAFPLTANCFPV